MRISCLSVAWGVATSATCELDAVTIGLVSAVVVVDESAVGKIFCTSCRAVLIWFWATSIKFDNVLGSTTVTSSGVSFDSNGLLIRVVTQTTATTLVNTDAIQKAYCSRTAFGFCLMLRKNFFITEVYDLITYIYEPRTTTSPSITATPDRLMVSLSTGLRPSLLSSLRKVSSAALS